MVKIFLHTLIIITTNYLQGIVVGDVLDDKEKRRAAEDEMVR